MHTITLDLSDNRTDEQSLVQNAAHEAISLLSRLPNLTHLEIITNYRALPLTAQGLHENTYRASNAAIHKLCFNSFPTASRPHITLRDAGLERFIDQTLSDRARVGLPEMTAQEKPRLVLDYMDGKLGCNES